MDENLLDSIVIRYDGKEAADHVINLYSLGESIQGSARIISTCANFLVNFEYTKQFQAHDVTVVAKEPEANCYEITVLIHQILQSSLFSGFAGSALTAVISYIIAKQSNSKEEMKHLKEVALKSIEAATGRDEKTIDKLISTLDKMATGLLPAARQAVNPVGKYCDTLKIGDKSALKIDQIMKDAILSEENEEITDPKEFEVLFTELDLENNTGKIRLEGENDKRINAVITDPLIQKKDNEYVKALSQKARVTIQAKAAILDGNIIRLYISDFLSK